MKQNSKSFPAKAFINDNFQLLRTNLKSLIADANMLAKAAVEGKLATRADASKHGGDFQKIVSGVTRPLMPSSVINVTAEYVTEFLRVIYAEDYRYQR